MKIILHIDLLIIFNKVKVIKITHISVTIVNINICFLVFTIFELLISEASNLQIVVLHKGHIKDVGLFEL